jgi:hypothetical protein
MKFSPQPDKKFVKENRKWLTNPRDFRNPWNEDWTRIGAIYSSQEHKQNNP